MAGKCPKCDRRVSNVEVEDVEVKVGFQPKWHGVSFVCPYCKTILGVGIDPISLKADTVSEVVEKLKTGR